MAGTVAWSPSAALFERAENLFVPIDDAEALESDRTGRAEIEASVEAPVTAFQAAAA